jgi:hypothetical protein
MEKVNLYNAGRLLIPALSVDRVKSAQTHVARRAQAFEERDLVAAPIFLDEVVRSFSANEAPSQKAMRRVAAGSLQDLVQLPNGANLLTRFIETIVSLSSSALYKALLLGYLRINHHNSMISSLIRGTLVKNLAVIPERWKVRIDKYGLLDAPPGKRLAQLVMESRDLTPFRVFEDAGLRRGILLGGGFALCVFREICEDLSTQHTPERLDRFFQLIPDSFTDKSDERVQIAESNLPFIAKALLCPYVEREPEDDLRLQIIDTLVRLYRDPRLNATGWAEVDSDLVSILLRWLTAESFEMLMEVLNSSNQSMQWRSRERFWRRYIQNGYVKEAWVAFGPDAENQAGKLIRSGELRSRGSFGVLERSQIQGHHSVLLMRIGDLTISEWTHDGKVRFYRSRNLAAPALYKLRYNTDFLRADSRTDHFKVHLGNWQYDVAQYIREVTGLRV